MFESSHAFAPFDYLRVPYRIEPNLRRGLPQGLGLLRATGDTGAGRRLLWTLSGAGKNHHERQRLGIYRLDGFHLACRLSTCLAPALQDGQDPTWRRSDPIVDAAGKPVSAIWRDDAGNVFLPFDPGEVMQLMWSESYLSAGSRSWSAIARAVMVRAYYLVRPILPRSVQLAARRRVAGRQSIPTFPSWPVEHSLHELYDWVLSAAASVAGRPVPSLDPWPHGKSWALVLTHDVETIVGCANLGLLRDAERAHGYRSSWNFVPERYEVPDDTLQALRDEGCEIGVHGLRHDGRDLASRRLLEQRLPAIRAYATAWGAVGFRSPATQRAWDLMPRLGFEYDSSYPDTDPYEPQPGGCGTYLPFFNDETVELPITLPQDHTLFEILQHTDGAVWTAKAHAIRDHAGMALVLAHPDYAANEHLALAWKQLLEEFAEDDTMWQAIPRDVASWWRRRDASSILPDGDGWVVRGPAATEGRIRLTVGAQSPDTQERRP